MRNDHLRNIYAAWVEENRFINVKNTNLVDFESLSYTKKNRNLIIDNLHKNRINIIKLKKKKTMTLIVLILLLLIITTGNFLYISQLNNAVKLFYAFISLIYTLITGITSKFLIHDINLLKCTIKNLDKNKLLNESDTLCSTYVIDKYEKINEESNIKENNKIVNIDKLYIEYFDEIIKRRITNYKNYSNDKVKILEFKRKK